MKEIFDRCDVGRWNSYLCCWRLWVLEMKTEHSTTSCQDDLQEKTSSSSCSSSQWSDVVIIMLILAVFLSLIILVVTLTVLFVAVKLFAHFRAVSETEEIERYSHLAVSFQFYNCHNPSPSPKFNSKVQFQSPSQESNSVSKFYSGSWQSRFQL